MNYAIKLALAVSVSAAALLSPVNNFKAHAQVPEAVQIDLLQDKVKSAIKSKDSELLHSSIQSLKELGVKIEPNWYIEDAKGALRSGDLDRSEASLNEYVDVYGAKGLRYRKVLGLYKDIGEKREEAAAAAANPAPVEKDAPEAFVIAEPDEAPEVSVPKKAPIVAPKVEPKAEITADIDTAKEEELKEDAAKLRREKAALEKKLRDKAAADAAIQAQKDEETRLELERQRNEIYLADIARKEAEAEAQAARDRAAEDQRLMAIQLEQERLALEQENARNLETARLDAIRADREREANRISAAFAKQVWSRQAVNGGTSASLTSLPNGSLIVGGRKDGLGYMAGLSPSGVKNWERNPDAFRIITTLVPSSSGAFYAGGTHPRKFIAGKYNAAGEKIWKIKHASDGTGNDTGDSSNEVVDFLETGGGSVIIGAHQKMANGSNQVVFMGVDPKGEIAWQTDAPASFGSDLVGFARIDGRIVAMSATENIVSVSPSTGGVSDFVPGNSPVFDDSTVFKAGRDFGLLFSNGKDAGIDDGEISSSHEPSGNRVTRTLDVRPVDVSIINNTDIIYIDRDFRVTRLTNLTGNY